VQAPPSEQHPPTHPPTHPPHPRRSEYCWISWLARCYIATGRPRLAWQQYLALDGSEEAYQLLLLIANDCYRLGQFYYALKVWGQDATPPPCTHPWPWHTVMVNAQCTMCMSMHPVDDDECPAPQSHTNTPHTRHQPRLREPKCSHPHPPTPPPPRPLMCWSGWTPTRSFGTPSAARQWACSR
jgi:hypothetical protein